MTQSLNKQIGAFPAVKTGLHLREIARQVLGRNLVPRSNDAALEQAESRFNGIRVDARVNGVNVDSRRMLNGFVLRPHVAEQGRRGIIQRARVTAGIIRHNDFDRPAHVLLDVLCQRARFHVRRVKESQFALTLPDAHNNFFVSSASALPTALDSAHIGFIKFNRASQREPLRRCHRCSDPVEKIPSRFVADSQSPLELHRRHALPRFHEQQDGDKPLLKGQMGISEDRACSDAELIVTRIADQDFISSRHDPAASDTLRSRGPAKPFQQLSTASIIGEARHEIYQSHSRHHEKASQRNQETSAKEDQGGLTYRLCRGLTGRSARCGVRRTETNPVPAWTPAKHTGRSSQVDSHAHSEGSQLGLPCPYLASSRAIELLLGQSSQPHHEARDFYVCVPCAPRFFLATIVCDVDRGVQITRPVRAIRKFLPEFDPFNSELHGLSPLQRYDLGAELVRRALAEVQPAVIPQDEDVQLNATRIRKVGCAEFDPKFLIRVSAKAEDLRESFCGLFNHFLLFLPALHFVLLPRNQRGFTVSIVDNSLHFVYIIPKRKHSHFGLLNALLKRRPSSPIRSRWQRRRLAWFGKIAYQHLRS